MAATWSPEDGVAFRQFLAKVPEAKLKAIMEELCPATLTAEDILKNDAEAISRLSAMIAGWNAYEKALLALAKSQPRVEVAPTFQDMQ